MVNELLILKNRLYDNSGVDDIYEYLIISTENNTFHKKCMTPERAKSFSEKLDARPIAPIDLLGSDYQEVKSSDFEYPLPF